MEDMGNTNMEQNKNIAELFLGIAVSEISHVQWRCPVSIDNTVVMH